MKYLPKGYVRRDKEIYAKPMPIHQDIDFTGEIILFFSRT
jgi:hypothetical protein